MTLPKDISKLNLTNAQYKKLSVEEKIFIAEKLPSTGWDFYSEANLGIEKPEIPCVIDGVLIGE
jgi:hypothetical protein